MEIKIADFDLDTSLLAQSRQELQGWTTFTIGNLASVSVYETDRTLSIENFFVAKSERRQGIGTQIFKILERGARESGFTLLGLGIDCRNQDPAGALAFAKSLGFKVKDSGSMYIGLTKPLLSAVPASEPSQPVKANA